MHQYVRFATSWFACLNPRKGYKMHHQLLWFADTPEWSQSPQGVQDASKVDKNFCYLNPGLNPRKGYKMHHGKSHRRKAIIESQSPQGVQDASALVHNRRRNRKVSIPARGTRCIQIERGFADVGYSLNPRKGYKMHHFDFSLLFQHVNVSIPARGTRCILRRNRRDSSRQSLNPRKGYKMHLRFSGTLISPSLSQSPQGVQDASFYPFLLPFRTGSQSPQGVQDASKGKHLQKKWQLVSIPARGTRCIIKPRYYY